MAADINDLNILQQSAAKLNKGSAFNLQLAQQMSTIEELEERLQSLEEE